MFRDWENYYLLVGSAAGALIGLMFVVTTLTMGFDPSRVSRGAQVYIKPIVFHFSVVLIVSAILVVPKIPLPATGMALAFWAVIGIAVSAATTARLSRPGWEDPPNWSDKWFYGILPTVAYLELAGAAGAVWLVSGIACYAVGASILVLLLIGIRNACDLATSIVQALEIGAGRRESMSLSRRAFAARDARSSTTVHWSAG
jgi:hypothetical protein